MDRFSSEAMRVYVCRCGRVHVETRHIRRSFSVGEFISRMRTVLADTAFRRINESSIDRDEEMQATNQRR